MSGIHRDRRRPPSTGSGGRRGGARLFECGDAYVARLLENDARLRGLCIPAGERSLVVPAGKEAAFRRALRRAGFATAPAGG